MTEELTKIANYYGYVAQKDMAIEEMAELIKALNKHKRAKTDDEKEKAYEHIVEEIADVEIMLEQLKWILSCQLAVEDVKKQKIARQLERIEKERKENDESCDIDWKNN